MLKKKAAIYKRHMESDLWNNTNRSHDFVDLLVELEAERGIKIDGMDTARLREAGFTVEDATVNGVKTKNGEVLINLQSSKSLNSVLGHEITHVLEGTEAYKVLKDAVVKYAKSKGEYDKRLTDITKLYKKAEGADVDAELTADLVGDYLFTDEGFIKSLTEHRNLFQRIFDEVKYLCSIAVKGSNEETKLLKIKRAFEKALRESEGEVKHTVTENGVQSAPQYDLNSTNNAQESTLFAENEQKEALTDTNGENVQVSGEKRVQMDLKEDYAEYDKPITSDDVKKIHDIASKFPKMSINSFSSEDIKATQKWAHKFDRELGVKSPFFRASFGDWRAYDSSPVKIVTIDKNLSVSSGNAINKDTGRKFSWNKELADESTLNAPKEHKNDILYVSSNLSQIVENAILLDTAVSDKSSKRKLDGTSWMHSFYSIVNIDDKISLIKLFAEEVYSEKQGISFTRAYSLKYIEKIAEFDNGVLPDNGGLTDSPSATIYSISNLFDFVKTFDEKFKPNPVNEHLVNDDGTPKILYHQTEADITEFDPRHKGAGTNDDGTPFGIFMKPGDNDIGLKGKKQMALYAHIVNPLVVNDRTQLEYELKHMSPEYADLLKQRDALSVEYKQKIEDAAKAWGQYAKDYRASHPDATRSEIYEDSTFKELYDAEDILTEEWIQKADELSLKCKEVITQTLKDNKYDGVILKNDEGSGGRTVETYIALDPEQVKSATDNIGTYSKYEKDIRFSLSDQNAEGDLAPMGRYDVRGDDVAYVGDDLAPLKPEYSSGGAQYSLSGGPVLDDDLPLSEKYKEERERSSLAPLKSTTFPTTILTREKNPAIL